MGLGFFGGSGGGSGIKKVADAAALAALTPVDGLFVVQLDTDELYYWDTTLAVWTLWAKITDHADLVTVIAALSSHLSDAVDAHDASAISYVNTTSGLAAIEVQAALDEIDGNVDANATALANHLSDAVDAHDASAISYVNTTSGLAAIEVQAAIDELSALLIDNTPSKFAVYDTAGNLVPLNEWSLSALNGANVNQSIAPTNPGVQTYLNLQNYNLYINPTDNQTLNNFSHFNCQMTLDSAFDYSGSSFLNSSISHIGSGDLVTVTSFNLNISLGNGTDGSASSGATLVNTTMSVENGYTVPNLNGMYTGCTVKAGAIVNGVVGITAQHVLQEALTGGATGFTYNVAISAAQAGWINCFYTNPQVDAATAYMYIFSAQGNGTSAPTSYTGLQVSPAFATAINNFVGVNLSPSCDITSFTAFNAQPAGGAGGTYFNGFSLNLGIPYTNVNGVNLVTTDADFYTAVNVNVNGTGSNFYGMRVSSGGATYNNVTGIAIDLQNITSPSRKAAISSSGGNLNVNLSFTTISNLPTLVDSGHLITSTIQIVNGSPITGTDVICNNFSGLIDVQDDHVPSAFGLGLVSLGFVGQVGVAVGKTAASVSFAVAGGSIPASSTGGTITDICLYRGLGLVSAGGTLLVTNMYGFRYENALGFAPTNEWGVSVENANAENFFQKSIAIGTGTKKVSNSDVALEIGNSKTFLNSQVDNTQRAAITALEGMQIYNTDNKELEYYNGTEWTAAAGRLKIATAQNPTDASTPTIANYRRQLLPISGSGGHVSLADLDIATAQEGDELMLMGTDNDNTVTVVSATNTVLNGSCTLAADDVLSLVFFNGKWREISRR